MNGKIGEADQAKELHLKNILIGLFSASLSLMAHAADNICYDEANAFSTQAPEGWVADSEKAKELGLCIVYYLKGKDFDSSPAVIYPNLVKSDKNGQAAVDKILAGDIATFKEKSETLEILKQSPIQSKSKLDFAVRHFRKGPPPNEFEAVAYHPGKKAVLIVVLSSRNEKDFDTQKVKLEEFLKAIKPVSRKDLAQYRKSKK